jgi:methylglutaconyl-CoA hydratase
MIGGLLTAMDELANARPARRLLSGNGRHFPGRRRSQVDQGGQRASADENVRVSRATAGAVDRLNRLPVPTSLWCRGLLRRRHRRRCGLRCRDRRRQRHFSISEVRWGLTAAIILPQLSDAIGVRQLRRYALTASASARQRPCASASPTRSCRFELAAAGERDRRAAAGERPVRMAETKQIALQSAWGGFSRATFEALVQSHAEKRRSPEPPRPRSFARTAANWK